MNDTSAERLELKIATFLRGGLLVAGTLILVGWLMGLRWNADPFFNYQIYDVAPLQNILYVYYRNRNWGMLLTYVGLFCLILLPLIRVVLTAWLFFRQGEKHLGFMAIGVFFILLLSMTLGFEL